MIIFPLLFSFTVIIFVAIIQITSLMRLKRTWLDHLPVRLLSAGFTRIARNADTVLHIQTTLLLRISLRPNFQPNVH
jgi:hypothetical protein